MACLDFDRLLPFSLFLLGVRNLILIIGLVGTIIFAFQVVIILLIHKKAKFSQIKPAYEINSLPILYYYILGALAVLGALLEIWYNWGRALVVQRIGREIPDLVIGVRFLSRA